MDYPKSIAGVGLVNGGVIDEKTVAGTPGSLIPAAWGNSVTQETLNAIKAAGLTPEETKTNQLATAIGALVDFTKLKNTPSTLAGYGITDAVGRLLAVRQIDAVGITVYKPNPRAKRIRVRSIGAGGSGGGCEPLPAGAQTLGGGGPFSGSNTVGNAGVRGSGGGGSCSVHASASIVSGAGGNAFCEIGEYE